MHIVAMREGGYICKNPEIMMTREEIAAIDRECEEQQAIARRMLADGPLSDKVSCFFRHEFHFFMIFKKKLREFSDVRGMTKKHASHEHEKHPGHFHAEVHRPDARFRLQKVPMFEIQIKRSEPWGS